MENFEIQIFIKSFQSSFLTKEGSCFVCGKNEYNQLTSLDERDLEKFTYLLLPQQEKFKLLCFGDQHSIVLTQDKKCYIWGKNGYGELGLGDTTNRNSPTLFSLPNNEKISFITCGTNHTICLTENNLCYGWGYNDYGELGLGHTNSCFYPTQMILPNNEIISFLSTGFNHSICTTINGLCYVWGYNYYGQLGLGDRFHRYTPTLLILLNNEKVINMKCGGTFIICMTNKDNYYGWGNNISAQLGLGTTLASHTTPSLLTLPNNERISFITCGGAHAICLTENNLCYVWGNNEYGQLGLGDTNNRSMPTLFSLPNNEKISFITCGDYHTMWLTENNLCYVCGYNRHGQLGLGDKYDRSRPILLTLPK